MKRCPKCRTDYFDNMLDFCLDDGERLLLLKNTGEIEKAVPTQAETVVFSPDSLPANFEPSGIENDAQTSLTGQAKKTEKLKEEVKQKWLKALEISPLILALAHNYWQWLYLARKYYYEFFDYFFSSAFLIWLLLLITTFVFGIISLKYSKRKDFAITALIVLAINVLLSIVPK